MTTLVTGAIGAAVGFAVGGPAGAMYGWAIGSAAGALLFPPEMQGPRLDDLKVQVSTYGNPIPKVYGTVRIAGNVIWASDLTEHEQTESAKGGPEVTHFTYSGSCAVLICQGPVTGIRRIWANKRLIYDVSGGIRWDGEGNLVEALSSTGTEDPVIGSLRIYTGTETQTADALIVANKGTSPAYRGWCYVVFEDLDLTSHFANRLPSFEFEVVQDGTEDVADLSELGDESGGRCCAVDPTTGYVWSAYVIAGTPNVCHITVIDPSTNEEIARFSREGGGGITTTCITYVPITQEFWVAHDTASTIFVFSAISNTWVGDIDPGVGGTGAGRLCYESHLGHVWLLRWSGSVYIVNPLTRTCTHSFTVTVGSGTGASVCDVKSVVSGEQTYVALLAGDFLHLYIPVTLYSTPDASYTLPGTYGASNGGGRLAYDSTRNVLVMSANGGALNSSGKVAVFDLDAETVSEVNLNTSWSPSSSVQVTKDIFYHEDRDFYYVIGHVSGGADVNVIELDPDTRTITQIIEHDADEVDFSIPQTPGSGALGDGFMALSNDSNRLLWVGLNASLEPIAMLVPIGASLTPGTVPLSEVVADLCEEAGLSSSDINVTELTDEVMGYVVGRQMTARAAIEALQPAYFFDGVESDDKLKFVKRGGALATTMVEDERAAHEGGKTPPALTIVRDQELEGPRTVEIRFFDPVRDYETSSAYDRRTTRGSLSEQTLDLPIVLTPLKGSQIASVNLYLAWQRQRFQWSTTRKYSKYEPTDVVTLPTASADYNVRITNKREHPNGIIEWEGVAEDAAVYSQNGVVSATSDYPSQTIFSTGSAQLRLMDIPILRDDDDDPGFYAAQAVIGSESGATLYRSTDAGSSYGVVETMPQESIIGVAGALGNFTGGNVFDYQNTVSVGLIDGTLSSTSTLAVLNGANLALLGDELIQFKTATLTATNTYTISGLLRGRFGTEWAINSHVGGERFVLVDESKWRRISGSISTLNVSRSYKAPVFGGRLSSAPAQTFTNTGIGLKPYSGVRLRGSRDGSGDLTITWLRRTRLSWYSISTAEAPLGEDSEAYEVDILSSGSPDTVLRTLSGSSESVTYTAAQQVTDFGSAQSSVNVRVYQISSTSAVGRGYPLAGSV